MPTSVQVRTPEPQTADRYHHDPHLHNKNSIHREALQLALGSILTPKRPQSRSTGTSGSLSPTYSAYSTAPHTPGTGTPVHPHPFGSEYLHPHHGHAYHYHHPSHSPSHPPSRLAQSSNASQNVSPHNSNHPSPTSKPVILLPISDDAEDTGRPFSLPPAGRDDYAPPSPGLGPISDSDPHLRTLRPTVTPLQPHNDAHHKPASLPNDLPSVGGGGRRSPASGTGTPKAKFLQTLQGKSAWDALIHGSFS